MDLKGPLALLLLLLPSCGNGLSGKAYSLDGGRPRSGHTPCGELVCDPGWYCQESTFSACAPGCRSDDNCAEGLECDPDEMTTSDGACVQPVPGAEESEECLETGKCEGDRYYCYFGEATDTKGTCRFPCSTSFDCSREGLSMYECCPVRGVSAAACVPAAVAPNDGSCW